MSKQTIIFDDGNGRRFGYYDGLPFTSGAGHDLCCAMGIQFAKLQRDLAECYRLTGADPDGNEDWRLAKDAVEEVRRMRQEVDRCEASNCRLLDCLRWYVEHDTTGDSEYYESGRQRAIKAIGEAVKR